MRTLLAAVVLAALIVAGVAIVAPLIARPIIISAVQAASPFGDQQLDIDVDCNVFGLLQGNVDRIHVRGADLKRGDATVGALDITLTGVATSGHGFARVRGTLAAITFPIDDGSSVTIDEMTLGGSFPDTSAVATLDRAAAVRLIASALTDAGIDARGVELGSGTVAFQVFGTRAEVPIGVEDGAIVLVDPFGTGSFQIVIPGVDDGWQLTGVALTPGGMAIDASLDVERLLGSS